MKHKVYFLQSLADPQRTYTGYTEQEVEERLTNHNTGSSPVTRLHKPWKIIYFMSFPDVTTARRFEAYCHTGSGRAWAARHVFALS